MRWVVLIVAYGAVLLASRWLAYELRFDFNLSPPEWVTLKRHWWWVPAVQIEDLLGREPVQLDTQEIRHQLVGQTVLVTGAGGSIGGELCRQLEEAVHQAEPQQLKDLLHRIVPEYIPFNREAVSAGVTSAFAANGASPAEREQEAALISA